MLTKFLTAVEDCTASERVACTAAATEGAMNKQLETDEITASQVSRATCSWGLLMQPHPQLQGAILRTRVGLQGGGRGGCKLEP